MNFENNRNAGFSDKLAFFKIRESPSDIKFSFSDNVGRFFIVDYSHKKNSDSIKDSKKSACRKSDIEYDNTAFECGNRNE